MNGMAAFDITSHGDTSDSCIDFCCYFCEENDVKMKADFFCERCSKCYCSGCIEQHRHIFKKHVGVYGRGEMDSWPEMPAIVAALERCENHADRKLELYCEDHRKLLCHICHLQNHRSCSKVSLIADTIGGSNAPDQDLRQTLKGLLKKQETLRIKARVFENQIDTLKSSHADIIEKIDICFIYTIATLDKIEAKTIENLDTLHSNMTDKLTALITRCDDLHATWKRLDDCVRGTRHTNASLSFISHKKCVDQMNKTDLLLNELATVEGNILQFTPDACIQQYLSSSRLLGTVVIPHQALTVDNRSKQHYTILLGGDTQTCSIRDICEVPFEYYIITDVTNVKVKMLNNKFTVVSYIDMHANPMCVCHIASGKVAVTLQNKTIQFVRAEDGHLKFNGEPLIMGHECRGIAHHGDNLYVTSGTALYQYTMDGQRTKVLYEGTSGSHYAKWGQPERQHVCSTCEIETEKQEVRERG